MASYKSICSPPSIISTCITFSHIYNFATFFSFVHSLFSSFLILFADSNIHTFCQSVFASGSQFKLCFIRPHKIIMAGPVFPNLNGICIDYLVFWRCSLFCLPTIPSLFFFRASCHFQITHTNRNIPRIYQINYCFHLWFRVEPYFIFSNQGQEMNLASYWNILKAIILIRPSISRRACKYSLRLSWL